MESQCDSLSLLELILSQVEGEFGERIIHSADPAGKPHYDVIFVSNSPGYRLNYLVCRLDGLDRRPSIGYIPNEPDAVLGLLQAVRVVHRVF